MAQVQDEPDQTLVSGLGQLVSLGNVLLEKAKQEAEASLESFVPNKITTLFGLITAGATFYKSLGVTKKSEAEAIWQKSCHHAAVKEQVDQLLQLQTNWDSFLESVDAGLQVIDGQPSEKTTERLSPDNTFTDARSGKTVTLGQVLDQGQKLLLVLIRHFG